MKRCCGRVVTAIDSKSIEVILVGSSPASIEFLDLWSFILFFNLSHLPIISTQADTVPDTMKQLLLLLPTCNNNIVPLAFFANFLLMRQMLDIFNLLLTYLYTQAFCIDTIIKSAFFPVFMPHCDKWQQKQG